MDGGLLLAGAGGQDNAAEAATPLGQSQCIIKQHSVSDTPRAISTLGCLPYAKFSVTFLAGHGKTFPPPHR